MTANKILNKTDMKLAIGKWKSEGKEVVFTNGCFDIIHLGHVDYLEKSSQLGQKLIVGLNADDSVKRLKGDNRPLNNQMARARILAAFEFVDGVVLFNEDTPKELISELLPDILVKGNDYLAENIVGADIVKANGGRVETISLVEGYSTTNIVEKIKKTK
jgi:rfaE bifunctional protein nucleotidyltransferase chain/domain